MLSFAKVYIFKMLGFVMVSICFAVEKSQGLRNRQKKEQE